MVIDIHSDDDERLDLLESISKNYPHVFRVGMINFDNQVLIRKMLEENLMQHIIFKPWHADDLQVEIHKVMKTRSYIYQRPLLEFVNQVDVLPTLPQIYQNLKDMIKNHASIGQISALIQEDLALTAFVLKVANSAYYGRKTGDVVHAIMRIGLCSLKDIVLTYSVSNFVTSDQKQLDQIRQRAIITNRLMTEIYEKCLHQNVPTYFASAGLLHDIGQLLLLAYEDSNANLKMDISDHAHQRLGGYLLNVWGLPYGYVEAAMFHHRPFDSRVINKTLVGVLALVHYYLGDPLEEKTVDLLFEKLNLDVEAVQACVSEILKI